MKRAVWRRVAPSLVPSLRRSSRRIGIALLHHRVGDPPGDPETELVPALGLAEFEAQLEHLAARYNVVPASRLPDAIATRRRGERIPVAITFDDDLDSHRQVAAPALKRHGLTATFFLSGTSLDGPFRFWWERLQDAVDRDLDVAVALSPLVTLPGRGRTPTVLELAAAIRPLEAGRRQAVSERLAELTGPDPADAGLRSGDVRWLVESGFEIGFHTRQHHYLPNLDDNALRDAMIDGRDRLSDVVGQPLTTIAYPHGGADGRVAAAARASGFRAGFTTAPEAATASTDTFLIGRVDPIYNDGGAFDADVAWRLFRA